MTDLPSWRESILQRNVTATRIKLEGPRQIAEAYIPRAQLYLGWLRHNLALAMVDHGVMHRTLENGVRLRMMYAGGMNFITISVPAVTSEQRLVEFTYHKFWMYYRDADTVYGWDRPFTNDIGTPRTGTTMRFYVHNSTFYDSLQNSYKLTLDADRDFCFATREASEQTNQVDQRQVSGNQFVFDDQDVYSFWHSARGDFPLWHNVDQQSQLPLPELSPQFFSGNIVWNIARAELVGYADSLYTTVPTIIYKNGSPFIVLRAIHNAYTKTLYNILGFSVVHDADNGKTYYFVVYGYNGCKDIRIRVYDHLLNSLSIIQPFAAPFANDVFLPVRASQSGTKFALVVWQETDAAGEIHSSTVIELTLARTPSTDTWFVAQETRQYQDRIQTTTRFNAQSDNTLEKTGDYTFNETGEVVIGCVYSQDQLNLLRIVYNNHKTQHNTYSRTPTEVGVPQDNETVDVTTSMQFTRSVRLVAPGFSRSLENSSGSSASAYKAVSKWTGIQRLLKRKQLESTASATYSTSRVRHIDLLSKSLLYDLKNVTQNTTSFQTWVTDDVDVVGSHGTYSLTRAIVDITTDTVRRKMPKGLSKTLLSNTTDNSSTTDTVTPGVDPAIVIPEPDVFFFGGSATAPIAQEYPGKEYTVYPEKENVVLVIDRRGKAHLSWLFAAEIDFFGSTYYFFDTAWSNKYGALPVNSATARLMPAGLY